MSDDREIVMRMIERAADDRRTCPTNGELVFALGYSSPASAVRVLAGLEKDGLITIARGNHSRVITIVSSGKRTAGEIPAPHWRHRPENAHRKNIQYTALKRTRPLAKAEPKQKLEARRVDRDPCSRCGVRADVGCSHQKPVDNFAVQKDRAVELGA